MKGNGVDLQFDRQTWDRMMKTRKNIISKARVETVRCKFCDSMDIFRFGHTKKGTQRYICNDCGGTFIDNKAPPRMRFPSEAIALALNLFYESASLSKIQRQVELTYGLRPDRMTVYRWIVRYSQKATKALSDVPIKVGSTWVADETMIGLKEKGGSKQWFWDIIDDKTRFLLGSHLSQSRTTGDAQTLVERAAKRAGKVPRIVTTDKLVAYLDGIELAFGADTKHIRAKKLTAESGTQLIERFHSTLKERTKVMRSFFRRGTAKTVMDGWLVHYNFFRPHSAVGNKTPAEAAGADAPFKSWADVVKGGNK